MPPNENPPDNIGKTSIIHEKTIINNVGYYLPPGAPPKLD
jgi:hypothetical protein